MVTSRDVARVAGVAQSTVSRVFTGSAEISADTRERVQSVAAALGYQPNIVARNLVRRTSRTIALGGFGSDGPLTFSRLKQSSFHFYLDVLPSIEREIDAHGYDLLLPTRNYMSPDDFVHHLRTRQVAGVVMIPPTAVDARVQAVVAAGIPVVVIDATGYGGAVVSVQADNVRGMYRATRYLLGLGHRRIAYLSGPTWMLAGAERLAGWQQALGEEGVPIETDLIRQSGFEMEEAYQATLALLDEHRDFTALVAASDGMAIGALRALRERGLRVPADVSVVGFDDIQYCLFTDPPLTTVRQDGAAIGQTAVRTLLGMICGDRVESGAIVVPAELIIRASAGPPPL